VIQARASLRGTRWEDPLLVTKITSPLVLSSAVRDGAGFARLDTVMDALYQGVRPACLSSSLRPCSAHAC